MYNYLMPKFGNDEDLCKSYALRLLVHYVGDLVQPFHCETRFNDEFNTKDGDKGANMFPLKNHYEVILKMIQQIKTHLFWLKQNS